MDNIKIEVTLAPGARVPTQGYSGEDAGWDLYTNESVLVPPNHLRSIGTGVYIALPDGYWAHLISRSSTPRRYGIHVVDAVLDTGYRGELSICVRNHSEHSVRIPNGVRIAQIILHQIIPVVWREVPELPPSARSLNGFGSTGE